MGEFAKTDAANAEFADITARPTAALAAVINPDFELRRSFLLYDQTGLCHLSFPL
jgi:hypothetical protein